MSASSGQCSDPRQTYAPGAEEASDAVDIVEVVASISNGRNARPRRCASSATTTKNPLSTQPDTCRFDQHSKILRREVAPAFVTDSTSISSRTAGAPISAESLRLVAISGAHHHYGTVRLAQNVLQGCRARGFPYSSPGKDDEVRGLSFGQAQHLRGCSAMGEEHPHVDVVKRAKARDTIDKLAAPSGPFVLWLIDITWCGERASLRRSSPDIRYVDHQKFSATTFGKLCRRLECGAGGGCSIVRHHRHAEDATVLHRAPAAPAPPDKEHRAALSSPCGPASSPARCHCACT